MHRLPETKSRVFTIHKYIDPVRFQSDAVALVLEKICGVCEYTVSAWVSVVGFEIERVCHVCVMWPVVVAGAGA